MLTVLVSHYKLRKAHRAASDTQLTYSHPVIRAPAVCLVSSHWVGPDPRLPILSQQSYERLGLGFDDQHLWQAWLRLRPAGP